MSYQSEAALENEVMDRLVDLGYERVNILNDDQLKENFRKILNERHIDKLNNEPLTDREFERLMTQINGKSVFESAQILRDKFVLKRDDETEVYLEFFNTKKWCQNKFQVTNQISVNDKYKGRYDVTLLINGLPILQMELKRSGIAISEAFNQVERYRRHNYTGLFRYVQLFVISNGQETRYYANSDKEIYKSHMFYWSDVENNRINQLKDFMDDFLEPCHMSKMVARYMIVNETDKFLMVMRPYQVYAVEALMHRALETNNNGYIWHTTGSGKTLTSFKAAQLLSEEEGIDKVIFLVDRKDLDGQTLSEFNKFQKDSVDQTTNTNKLIQQLADKSRPLLITTIQKLANVVRRNDKVLERYQTDKVVFIIDECHRSQFGDMHRQIKANFKNAQYFGFTGTPLFEENKSQDGRSTADIFDKCLHTYLIKDAIRDNNVLGFSVEYIQTFKNNVGTGNEEYVEDINTNEVWMNDNRIEMVARHIYKNHNKKTKDRQYSAIFATANIPMAMKYYEVFKKINAEEVAAGRAPLKVATISTYQTNEDMQEGEVTEHSKDLIANAIEDYNQLFNTNFNLETFDNYFKDVSNRVKKGIKNEKIDILIVVNMFLTGFDSKVLNTLYVDKNLQYHGLIQAYSRTNRVEKITKPYGNIVCYRDLKKATDDAITLFSQTNDTDTVLNKTYDQYLRLFVNAIEELYEIAPTPESVDLLEGETAQKEFVEAFRDVANLMQKMRTFDEFEFDSAKLGIAEQTFEDYKGKYFAIYEEVKKEREQKEEVSILDDIDFEIDLLRNDIINVDYILNLLKSLNLEDKKEKEAGIKQIHRLLDTADNEQLRLKADLIRTFMQRVLPSLNKGDNIDDAYYNFEEQEKEKEIENFSNTLSYPPQQLNRLVHEYEFSGNINRNDIDRHIDGGLLVKRNKTKKIESFIRETTRKYGNVE
ncbi:type I restriction endonuclease subunit R [Macrococcoides caseolyticum]|uniref:type I restriction endonuclease subunit R n=1 Tax=Macrococcoides caseolyticum TaxID=69966 RepID=UPI000C332EE0|nr:type I restriction endonuclease subunit R [Macrococcus caseolyticus]PKE62343.1 restriction endonuclease subunit R [Macrococcus caseolyticus]PKF44665.1 restriction endonuclease subunit R [Macrococcus caseolyticus]